MEEIAQKANQCVYAAFRGDDVKRFAPDQLTTLAQAALPLGHITVTVRIIGESHCLFVEDYHGHTLFAEILACKELSDIGMEEPGTYIRLLGNPRFTVVLEQEHGISTETRVGIKRERASCRSIAKKILACPEGPWQATSLVWAFPFKGKAPRTIVAVRALVTEHSTTVYLHSLHEYYSPDNGLTTPLVSETTLTINSRKVA